MELEQDKQQNKMGVLPINKLLLSMALPMMASMLVQALYNIVDSIFVSKISEDALSAVSLAFPVQTFMIAIGSGTGVGINAYLSRSLGENNRRNVNRAATNGIMLVFISALIFIIFGLFFVRMFFDGQSADNPEIIEYGVSYLSICSVLSFALFGQMTFERLLQSTGKTFYAMITQGTGAIINLILGNINSYKGQVLIDNNNLKEVKLDIGTVSQEIELFNMSIKDNLCLDKKISDEEIIKYLKELELNEILLMEEGIHTIVGEKGLKLSTGQKRRINILRSYLMDKDIYILDEPTSNLDKHTEEIVVNFILKYFKNKTLIIVTHNEKINEICNKFYKIENHSLTKLNM